MHASVALSWLRLLQKYNYTDTVHYIWFLQWIPSNEFNCPWISRHQYRTLPRLEFQMHLATSKHMECNSKRASSRQRACMNLTSKVLPERNGSILLNEIRSFKTELIFETSVHPRRRRGILAGHNPVSSQQQYHQRDSCWYTSQLSAGERSPLFTRHFHNDKSWLSTIRKAYAFANFVWFFNRTEFRNPYKTTNISHTNSSEVRGRGLFNL